MHPNAAMSHGQILAAGRCHGASTSPQSSVSDESESDVQTQAVRTKMSHREASSASDDPLTIKTFGHS